MKSKVLSIFFIALFVFEVDSFAQNKQSISENDKRIILERMKEKVAMMNTYIAFMADPQKKNEARFYYKEEAQNLFINNCNSFTEIVEFEDDEKETIQRDGVTMQVASSRNQTPRTKLMKEYFRGLIKMNYKYVRIKTTDIADMRVSKLQPYGRDGDGKQLYVCSVFFDQVFVGITPEGRKYQDITRKWVVCYVQVDEVLDERTGEIYSEYMVRLGDVHVESIKPW